MKVLGPVELVSYPDYSTDSGAENRIGELLRGAGPR